MLAGHPQDGSLGITSGFLAAMIVLAANLQAAPILDHVTTLTLPSGQNSMGRPVAVTCGAGSGEVCVTDAAASSGRLFSNQNVLVFSTGSTAGLSDPNDMTVDASGDLVCTDSRPQGGRTIRLLNLFGEAVAYEPESPASSWYPEHLLITRDGNYVTTDPASGFLAKHEAGTGKLLWKRVPGDQRSGELLGLGRPAEAPDGRLYVPLGGDRLVAVLSAEGEYQTSFGFPGTARGRLSFPVGVAFCPDGTIAVLDRMRNVILFYDADHAFLAEFGEYGTGPRNLYQPVSIAATPDGRVYVAQGFQGRVHMFRYSATGAAHMTTDRPLLIASGVNGAVHPLPLGRGVSIVDSSVAAAIGRGSRPAMRSLTNLDLINGGC